MSQKRSRITRYAELRRKIEDMDYYSFGNEDAPSTDFKADSEKKETTDFKNSPKVLHNTLSIPLSALIEEDGKYKNRRAMMSTQEFNVIDTAPEERARKKRGKSVSKQPNPVQGLFKKWWTWLIVGLIIVAIIVLIAVYAFNF